MRAVIAAVFGLLAAVLFRAVVTQNDPPMLWMPSVLLVASSVAALVPRLGAQLFARAAWWSNFLIGVLLCCIGNHSERHAGVPFMLACGAALVAADRRALLAARAAAGYRPARFFTTLQLMMVLALADAMTLGLFSSLWLRDGDYGIGALTGALTLALIVGFVGLYRLALWGIAATMGVAATLLVALGLGAFQNMDKLAVPLTILALVQLTVPLPMIVSMVRGRGQSTQSESRLPAWAPSAFVIGVAAAGVVTAALR